MSLPNCTPDGGFANSWFSFIKLTIPEQMAFATSSTTVRNILIGSPPFTAKVNNLTITEPAEAALGLLMGVLLSLYGYEYLCWNWLMESRRDIRQTPLSFEVQFASGNRGKPAAAHSK